ncbi:helix-turn-helix transcriptional regulator [Methylobacterium nodulans]|uniref:Helix-turn-helix domain-containing protein n=1 Tax=Methylobacterium nodulans (strain LMG 21967 / CNCM I-2342 / ORS 2060) TaxID=460265 RepID=B8IGN3_METNO|nr:helix-turn-helix domain-containing protein [Methylobacterium nodulans]ACL55933.1 hypothetical protein Mnod_0914 [Methylobacterium nodulans ORS 2060]
MATDTVGKRATLVDDLLTRDAAARLLDVSPRTLDRWHLLRSGPPRIEIGRKIRYRLSSIKRWLADHEATDVRTRQPTPAERLRSRR